MFGQNGPYFRFELKDSGVKLSKYTYTGLHFDSINFNRVASNFKLCKIYFPHFVFSIFKLKFVFEDRFDKTLCTWVVNHSADKFLYPYETYLWSKYFRESKFETIGERKYGDFCINFVTLIL